MGISIHLENIGKRYIREWVFKNLTYIFEQGNSYAITGHNGSGKSTLCHLLTGMIPPTEGTLIYRKGSVDIDPDEWHQQLSMAAPYQELIEEFTLLELLQFHSKFRPWQHGVDTEQFMQRTYLADSRNKPVANFSSGMRQRLRLGLAFFGQSPVIFLDEPTANLDTQGKDWYLQQVGQLGSDRLLIISSNDEMEFSMCKKVIDIAAFK